MFIVYRGYRLGLHDVRGDDDENEPKQTQDASVWALGKFFLFFFRVFSCFFNVYCLYRLYSTKYTKWRVETTKTGPNGCETHPFGPRCVFLFFFRVFL